MIEVVYNIEGMRQLAAPSLSTCVRKTSSGSVSATAYERCLRPEINPQPTPRGVEMISREKCLEWAIASGAKPLYAEVDIEFVEALVNRAYTEGLKDANPCKECKAIGAAVRVVRDAERDAAKASAGY